MDQQSGTPVASAKGERKQITAVFLDVVGFSDMASTADAEDLQGWLEDFYSQCDAVIAAHDGEVTEYLGDGVVALFGLARADELAASKAVTAALAAITKIDSGADGASKIKLRIGVATGEVAVRAETARDNLPRATGMVTTLAQRIQEQAAPGTVMIAESTRNLLRGSLSVETFDGVTLKGFADPQTLFRPLAAPLSGPASSGVFVGRKAEQDKIAASKDPCLIIGQAGIGKSALARHIAKGAAQATRFAADGVHIRASYQPFTQWVMQQTGMQLPEYADIEKHFADLPEEAQQALGLFLGLPEGQRLLAEKSNVALKGLIEDSLWQAIQAKQHDGLLVFEDLHWLDNASFGLLVHILQSDAAKRYQIVMTSREDTKIGKYLGRLPITMVALGAFDDVDAGLMLDTLSQGVAAPADRAALIAKAAGIPLFLEQLHKRKSVDMDAATVPGSLMDLLADQIDATGPAKSIVQCAAIIGQSFEPEMVAVLANDAGPLDAHLEKACAQGVLQYVDGQGWGFAHALLHQAAYQGMLRRTRIDYHGQLAAHLQDHHADAVRRNPALLTDHLRLAQQHVPAIQNLLAVSQWALFQGAFDDAEAHILTAITLCAEAPADVDVRALEIACYTALGSIRMQTLGFTAQPVRDAFDQVATLAGSQNAYSVVNGPAFYGSFTHAVVSADKPSSDRFSGLLREAANTVPVEDAGQTLRLASHNVDTSLHFYTGDFAKQFDEFAALREIYDVSQHGAMIVTYGADTFAAAQMFETAGRAITGDTHLVADLIAETDAHQKLLNIPVMLPWAQIWGAVPLFYAGETDVAIARVQKGLQTATSQTAAFWQVTGAAWLNVMDPSQSETAEGLAGFDQVIKTHEMIGANVGIPYFRAHYAMALARHGDDAGAFQASLQATRENEANGLLCWYPEVLRIHAQSCRNMGRNQDARQYLAEAVTIAIQQNARLWLLRARIDQHTHDQASDAELQDVLNLFDPAAQPPEVAAAQSMLAAT